MSIKALTKELSSLEALQKALEKKSEVLIGSSGGRSFCLGTESKITVKMKDLVHHLDALSQKEGADKESARKVANLLTMLDVMGDAKLAEATGWQRFLTAIRRFFGNLGFSSHVMELSKIFKNTVSTNPEPLSTEATALYDKCQLYVKANKALLPKLKRLALEEAKADDEKEITLTSEQEAAQEMLNESVEALQKLPLFAERVKVVEKIQKLSIFFSLFAINLVTSERGEDDEKKEGGEKLGVTCGLPLLYQDQFLRKITKMLFFAANKSQE
jgi:hypothetical protein